jgi:hypothetical protein
MPKTITVPFVKWVLGDHEQSTNSGVTISTRPLYRRFKGRDGTEPRTVKVGDVNPDYADLVMAALAKDK